MPNIVAAPSQRRRSGGSRVHAPDTSGCALWPGVRTWSPLNRWLPACWPATIGFMPSPWKKVTYLAVGGLTEVGFATGSLLLVVSHQGRAVVDPASGDILARDRQETGAWFNAARRAVLGIGPLDGTWTGICGLADGQLPGATTDGWQARASGDGVTVSAPGRRPLMVSDSEAPPTLRTTPQRIEKQLGGYCPTRLQWWSYWPRGCTTMAGHRRLGRCVACRCQLLVLAGTRPDVGCLDAGRPIASASARSRRTGP